MCRCSISTLHVGVQHASHESSPHLAVCIGCAQTYVAPALIQIADQQLIEQQPYDADVMLQPRANMSDYDVVTYTWGEDLPDGEEM